MCGIFLQEPRHKINEHWMAVFWVLSLSSLPLCYLVYNSISSWCWVRDRTLWHLGGIRKTTFACILTPWPLPWWVAKLLLVSLLLHCLGMVTESNNLLRRTSLINILKSAMGNILGPLFLKSLGPSRWLKNIFVSSKTCQVMWAHLICVYFYFTAVIEGWFKILHIFFTWSYRGHKYSNNTHNNAANVANISFNSYQFLGGRIGSDFLHLQCLRLSSCALVFLCHLFPSNLLYNLLCSTWYNHQW